MAIKVSEHDLGNRRSSRGRLFQTLGPTTENARFCMVAVRANGTATTPSQQSGGSDYPEPPTPAYRGLLGRLVQGQDGIAKPERQLYIRCAVGQEANAELPTYTW